MACAIRVVAWSFDSAGWQAAQSGVGGVPLTSAQNARNSAAALNLINAQMLHQNFQVHRDSCAQLVWSVICITITRVFYWGATIYNILGNKTP
jgi:hypothetical protein